MSQEIKSKTFLPSENLRLQAFNIIFAWIPSHTGINGNCFINTVARHPTNLCVIQEDRRWTTDDILKIMPPEC